MQASTPIEIVERLSGPTFAVRTGLWLVPRAVLRQPKDSAARLGIDASDIREPIQADLPSGTRFLGLSTSGLIRALDSLCVAPSGGNCLLVYNLDLLIARLYRQDRLEFWRTLFDGFPHRQRGLLLLMPLGADHLIPSSQTLEVWRHDGRLAVEPAAK